MCETATTTVLGTRVLIFTILETRRGHATCPRARATCCFCQSTPTAHPTTSPARAATWEFRGCALPCQRRHTRASRAGAASAVPAAGASRASHDATRERKARGSSARHVGSHRARDRPADVPLDERERRHHDVEGERQREAPVPLRVEAEHGHREAERLVQVCDGMGWDGMGWDGMGWGGVKPSASSRYASHAGRATPCCPTSAPATPAGRSLTRRPSCPSPPHPPFAPVPCTGPARAPRAPRRGGTSAQLATEAAGLGRALRTCVVLLDVDVAVLVRPAQHLSGEEQPAPDGRLHRGDDHLHVPRDGDGDRLASGPHERGQPVCDRSKAMRA